MRRGFMRLATAIAIEGRIKHVQAVRAGHSTSWQGLEFLGAAEREHLSRPTLGRGQETYGEDPCPDGAEWLWLL